MSRIVNWIKKIFTKSASKRNPDSETLSLLNDPKFLSILESAKEQKGKGGFSESEMREWLEAESTSDV
ncbi:MAG: hypothetical protein HC789_10910 [Microcoleus sp. CSU_2_2]|nr:hypothetical protein [Microcoleus sp. SU_5_3]NJS10832.1 hypothetical protein [Microcoleus sp. CSU_2_2]